MKRKFTSLLMLAFTVISVGFLASCKDYDEDNYAKLAADNATLSEYYKTLYNQVQELQDSLYKVKSCTCDPTVMQKVQEIIKEMGGASGAGSELTTFIEEVVNNYYKNTTEGKENINEIVNAAIEEYMKAHPSSTYDDTALKAWVLEELGKIKTCGCADPNLTQALVEGLIKTAIDNCKTDLTADLQKWVKEYVEGNNYVTQDQLTSLMNTIANEYAKKSDLTDAVAALNTTINDTKTYVDTELGKKVDYSVYSVAITNLQSGINEAKGYAEAALKLAKEDSTRIDDVLTKISDINTQISGLNSRLTTAETNISTLQGQVASDSVRIDVIKGLVDALDGKLSQTNTNVENLEKALNEYKTFVADNYATKQALKDSIADLRSQMKSLIAEREAYLQQQITDNTTKLGDLTTSLSALDTKLSGQISDLDSRVATVEKKVSDLEAKVDELTNTFNSKLNDLASQVTGIEIQSVYNPAIGSFSTPFNVNSNILVAYYGTSSDGISFPGGFEDVDQVTIARKSGVTLVDDYKNKKATAGQVYMTVNPSEVDFTGVTPVLANSQDVNSDVVLGPLAKTDKTLKFGYTRAADNGFYVSNATIDRDIIENSNAKLSIDNKKAVASSIKDFIKQHNSATLKEMAEQVFKAAQNLSLDAQGVKVTSKSNYGYSRTVTSQYGIAAVAVQPLNFTSLDALNDYDHVPGYSKAYTLLDKITEKVHKAVNRVYKRFNDESTIQDIEGLKINKINFDSIKGQFVVTIDTTIYLDGLKYYLDFSQEVEVPVKFDQDLTIPVDIKGVKVNVPVKIDKDVAVDMSNLNVKMPEIVITVDKDKNPTGKLVVPVTDKDGKDAGTTIIDLDELVENFVPEIKGGKMTLDGDVIANLSLDTTYEASVDIKQDVHYTLHIDQTVKTTVNVQKWIYFGDEADSEGNLTRRAVHILISKDFSDQIKSYITGALDNVNDMLDQINKTVIDAQDLINDINDRQQKINDKIDSYADKVRDYLDKIQSKVLALIHKASKLCTPVMLVNSDKGFGVLGSESTESGEVTICATTYSAGIVAPVLAKYVDVNGVQVEVDNQLGKANITSYLRSGKNIVRYAALDYAGHEVDRTYVIYYSK